VETIMREDMLRHAATKLRELQARIDSGQVKEGFNLDQWWEAVEYEEDNEVVCGTAGCFIGWAAHENWFKNFGYDMAIGSYKDGFYNRVMPSFNGHLCAGNHQVEAWATKMFGLEYPSTIQCLIYSEKYGCESDQITPLIVAERIEELLAAGENEFLESH
jgi:hypothetical protein